MRSLRNPNTRSIDPEYSILPTSSHIERYFQLISYTAVTLLWGASVLNGTIEALLLTVWNGTLENGIPLMTNYTGFPPLDYPLAVLVAFFFSGTSGRDEGFQLFLFDLYIILQLGYLWLYVEALRPGRKSRWIQSPIYMALFWQACGGAVALPLYYGMHIRWAGQKRQVTQVMDLHKARSLAVAFLFGAVVPMLLLMAPTWLGPQARSSAAQQTIIAFFQPSPIYVSCILTTTTGVSAYLSSRRSPGTVVGGDEGQASRWVRGLYLIAAAVSTLGHLSVLGRVFTATDKDSVNLTRMYIPFPFAGPAGTSEVLVRGSWLFLQWDNIIISLASTSWAFILLKGTALARKYTTSTILLVFLLGFVVLGPGATVTLALYLREGYLPEAYENSVHYAD